MEEHKTETAYWAGRMIGYPQAWEIAKEIVDTINEAKNISLNPDVIKSVCVHNWVRVEPKMICTKCNEEDIIID